MRTVDRDLIAEEDAAADLSSGMMIREEWANPPSMETLATRALPPSAHWRDGGVALRGSGYTPGDIVATREDTSSPWSAYAVGSPDEEGNREDTYLYDVDDDALRAAASEPMRTMEYARARGDRPYSTEVQSLLIPDAQYTREQALSWAHRHDFVAAKVDHGAEGRYWRVRQHDPRDYEEGSLRTITLSEARGIKAVIGVPKAGTGRCREKPAAEREALPIQIQESDRAMYRQIAEAANDYAQAKGLRQAPVLRSWSPPGSLGRWAAAVDPHGGWGDATWDDVNFLLAGAGVNPATSEALRVPKCPTGTGVRTAPGDRNRVSVDNLKPGTEAFRDALPRLTELLARHGWPVGHVIACGTMGCAYASATHPDLVIKITSDPTEAAANRNLLALSLDDLEAYFPAVVPPTCVLSIGSWWAIVLPRLQPLAKEDQGWLRRHGFKIADEIMDGPDLAGLPEREALASLPTWKKARDMSISFQRNLRSVVRTLIAMRASGMNWSDLHEGNVMQDAKGRWKLIDLGRSKWDSAEVPVLK